MEKNQYVYGYIVMSRDEPTVTVGLWELTRRYLEDHNIKPTFIHDFVKDGVWDLSYYYTNFEISSLDFWRSAPVRDYFDHVDRSGGIYKHRWGDTLIHTMAVSMFLEKNKTHRFTDIYYDHQGPFNEPKRPVNYLRKVMRKIRDVCFFTPINFLRQSINRILEPFPFLRRVAHSLREPRALPGKVMRKLRRIRS